MSPEELTVLDALAGGAVLVDSANNPATIFTPAEGVHTILPGRLGWSIAARLSAVQAIEPIRRGDPVIWQITQAGRQIVDRARAALTVGALDHPALDPITPVSNADVVEVPTQASLF